MSKPVSYPAGTRVMLLRDSGPFAAGEVGTIIYESDHDLTPLVSFDNARGRGHSGGGLLTDKFGWWVEAGNLKPVTAGEVAAPKKGDRVTLIRDSGPFKAGEVGTYHGSCLVVFDNARGRGHTACGELTDNSGWYVDPARYLSIVSGFSVGSRVALTRDSGPFRRGETGTVRKVTRSNVDDSITYFLVQIDNADRRGHDGGGVVTDRSAWNFLGSALRAVTEAEAAPKQKIMVGSRVKLLTSDGPFKAGECGRVIKVDSNVLVSFDSASGRGHSAGGRVSDHSAWYLAEDNLSVISGGPVPALKPGDYVKITANTNYHGFKIGEVVEVLKYISTTDYTPGQPVSFYEMRGSSGPTWAVREPDCVLVPKPAPKSTLKKGDYVKITANTNSHGFNIGDVVRVSTDLMPWKGVGGASEYFVAEKYGSTTLLKNVVVSDCVKCDPPKPQYLYKAGDLVKITANTNHHGFDIGQIVRIISLGTSYRGNHYCAKATTGDASWYVMESDIVPAPQSEPQSEPKRLYKPGDYVKITANTNCHGFDIGDVVKIAADQGMAFKGGFLYIAEHPTKRVAAHCLRECDCVPTSKPQSPRFKVGDYAKIIGNTTSHRYKNGDLVKITHVAHDGSRVYYNTTAADGNASWLVYDVDMEPAEAPKATVDMKRIERTLREEFARLPRFWGERSTEQDTQRDRLLRAAAVLNITSLT